MNLSMQLNSIAKSKNVEFDRKEMRELIKQATNIIGYFKGSFNRDRPVKLILLLILCRAKQTNQGLILADTHVNQD